MVKKGVNLAVERVLTSLLHTNKTHARTRRRSEIDWTENRGWEDEDAI